MTEDDPWGETLLTQQVVSVNRESLDSVNIAFAVRQAQPGRGLILGVSGCSNCYVGRSRAELSVRLLLEALEVNATCVKYDCCESGGEEFLIQFCEKSELEVREFLHQSVFW